MKIVSVGEILWDVVADTEFLGGAPFNFAVSAHRLGHEVSFVSAVGDDERGRRALARVRELGLSTEFIRVVPGVPTGVVTVRMVHGEPDYTIHRPAAYDFLVEPEIEADWVYSGTLKPASLRSGKRFYDLNLRKDSYTRERVEELMGLATVVKLSEAELAYTGRPLEELARQFGWSACCVTLGARGCVVRVGNEVAEVAGVKVEAMDPVGAGDAFAAAFLHGFDAGWPAREIGEFANRVGALVASRAGAVPEWSVEEL